MKCVVCKQGETRGVVATVTLSREQLTLVIKGVPTQVCDNCGEEYVDEASTGRLLETTEVIEEYPTDQPYPSRLILGWIGSQPLHLVVADNVDDAQTVVVTVYEPDLTNWEPEFRRRRP